MPSVLSTVKGVSVQMIVTDQKQATVARDAQYGQDLLNMQAPPKVGVGWVGVSV